MPTLTDAPEFTANEVNAIQGTDRLSGQFEGAEFGGIGNLNQAAQQLANRTAFLFGRQTTNIANIASLLSFMGKFKSQISSNPPGAVIWIPLQDTVLGPVTAMLQGGLYAPFGGIATPASVVIPFLSAFPTGCLFPPIAITVDDGGAGVGVSSCSVGISPSRTGFTCNMGFSGGAGTLEGIAWWAVGY